jgi:hypothetical protein
LLRMAMRALVVKGVTTRERPKEPHPIRASCSKPA